jgi:hypothetical protein
VRRARPAPAGHAGEPEDRRAHGAEYRTMPQAAVGVDAPITVHSAADVAARRARLIAYVWKGAGLPTRLPRVRAGVSVPACPCRRCAVAVHRPASVQMIGLSGGGWTTTVYAAIDPRVTRSHPVAGSLPFSLRGAAPNVTSSVGDREQRRDTLPGFYGAAAYLDLYVMAATGPGRRQLQILNRFDPCCCTTWVPRPT